MSAYIISNVNNNLFVHQVSTGPIDVQTVLSRRYRVKRMGHVSGLVSRPHLFRFFAFLIDCDAPHHIANQTQVVLAAFPTKTNGHGEKISVEFGDTAFLLPLLGRTSHGHWYND